MDSFSERPEREHGQECQGDQNERHPGNHPDEQRLVRLERAGGRGHGFLPGEGAGQAEHEHDRQQPVPVTEGTLPTYRPQFVGMLTGVTVIIVALTYFPALALGPLAEGLH